MSLQLEEKKVVKFVKSTKSVSITIANFENVVDGIRDEEILSQKFKVVWCFNVWLLKYSKYNICN